MAEWKKVLVQGADITVNSITLGSTAVSSTAAELNLLDGVSGLVQADFTKLAAIDSTAAEIDVLDGVTAGTAAASKAVVLDANKDIGTIRNLTINGNFSDGNYTFDTSGNVSGLGTIECNAITSSGDLAVTGTITGDTSLTLNMSLINI